jgi:ElaB/YqjD/DUF883 family membrane-anchored ribosome-binding protein
MNQELEDLIKALDAMLESRGQSKVIAEHRYREKIQEALAKRPGVNPKFLERAIYKTYQRWVKASQRPPAV